MVQSFLCSFVPADFVQDLDFSTLQMLPTEHVTETWHLRVNDIVWQIKYKGAPCLLYILMEFQKKVHHLMPVRMTIYACLLWQWLWEQRNKENRDKTKSKISKNYDLNVAFDSRKSPQLMPIFPIVIYNGESQWNATTSFNEIFGFIPKELKEFNPMNVFFLC